MPNLAFKNLTHDRVRLAVTLTGIVFALVLIIIQFGLFLGFLDTTANIVERSGADLWVSAPGLPHVNGGVEIPERRRYQALSVGGVARAEKYLVAFGNWKLPSGAQETVQVVGFSLDSGMGGPWDLTSGSVEALRGEDTVIIDELYAKQLGVTAAGQQGEIAGRRARVVGFTRGIRSFTTAPYVFTSFKNAQNYARIPENSTFFLQIRLAPGAPAGEVRRRLLERLGPVEVRTNAEMAKLTQNYWLFHTGAGASTLMGAVLGLLVGVVVVAQTIYATTMDHIREFGTLKAMGAGNRYVYGVILRQALISAVAGYAIAIVVGWWVARNSAASGAVILLPPEMAAAVFAVALAMCAAASVVSIRKATSIDPAMVFRG